MLPIAVTKAFFAFLMAFVEKAKIQQKVERREDAGKQIKKTERKIEDRVARLEAKVDEDLTGMKAILGDIKKDIRNREGSNEKALVLRQPYRPLLRNRYCKVCQTDKHDDSECFQQHPCKTCNEKGFCAHRRQLVARRRARIDALETFLDGDDDGKEELASELVESLTETTELSRSEKDVETQKKISTSAASRANEEEEEVFENEGSTEEEITPSNERLFALSGKRSPH